MKAVAAFSLGHLIVTLPVFRVLILNYLHYWQASHRCLCSKDASHDPPGDFQTCLMMVLIYKNWDYIHNKNHPLFFWFSFSSNLFSIADAVLVVGPANIQIITLEMEEMEEETFPEFFRNLYF